MLRYIIRVLFVRWPTRSVLSLERLGLVSRSREGEEDRWTFTTAGMLLAEQRGWV